MLKLFQQYVIPNYGRYPVALSRGEGSYVWDAEGNRYLDLFPGWGCGLLGHCPAPVVEAVREQLGQLIHVPNTWHTEFQGQWAKALSERSFGGQAFFCNSGTEANEAAIKLVRLHSTPKHRYKIITFEGGFHGRTLGSTDRHGPAQVSRGAGTADGRLRLCPLRRPRRRRPADRRRNGRHHDRADPGRRRRADSARRLPGRPAASWPTSTICCWSSTRCRRGFGRTGHWFAYQAAGVTPDIMTLSKALCGGMAGAAMLATPQIAPSLRPGMHAATFGGNPIAARAGLAAIEMIEKQNLLAAAKRLGEIFQQRLRATAAAVRSGPRGPRPRR